MSSTSSATTAAWIAAGAAVLSAVASAFFAYRAQQRSDEAWEAGQRAAEIVLLNVSGSISFVRDENDFRLDLVVANDGDIRMNGCTWNFAFRNTNGEVKWKAHAPFTVAVDPGTTAEYKIKTGYATPVGSLADGTFWLESWIGCSTRAAETDHTLYFVALDTVDQLTAYSSYATCALQPLDIQRTLDSPGEHSVPCPVVSQEGPD